VHIHPLRRDEVFNSLVALSNLALIMKYHRLILSVIMGAILAFVSHAHKVVDEPPSDVASFIEKHKPLISEFSVGVVGGVVTSALAKYFVKYSILIGAGVFVVSSGIVELTIPKIFDGQDQMLK
jgi:hypothetical protein